MPIGPVYDADWSMGHPVGVLLASAELAFGLSRTVVASAAAFGVFEGKGRRRIGGETEPSTRTCPRKLRRPISTNLAVTSHNPRNPSSLASLGRVAA